MMYSRTIMSLMLPALGLVGALMLIAEPLFAQQQAPTDADTPIISNYRVGDSVYVRALAIDDRNNSLWVGTSIGALGIDLASKDVKHTFTRDDGLANEYVFAIAVDPISGVWFGTNAGGMSHYDDGKWKTYFPMHGLADYWVYAFAFDERERLWIGTWDGVSVLDRSTGDMTTYRDELINIWVYGVDVDRDGRLWFGTEGGVSMFDGTEWHEWTHEEGLGAPNANDLPNSANTGLGTRSRHDLSIEVGESESYNPSYVFATLVDNRQRGVWFGTWGGGLSLFDGEQGWKNYTTDDGLAGNVVYSLAQAPDGGLWVGTNRGISYFDGAKWRSYRHGLLSPHVYAIALDGEGSVWAGTKGAVAHISFGE